MPDGADPHDFAPSSRQVATLMDAPVVIANGLGLESGLADALASSTADGANVLEVGPLVDPIPLADHADEHDHGNFDPHVWFDMSRMAQAATQIGDAIAVSTGDDAYRTCAAQQAAAITEAEKQVRAILSSVPADRRVIVTDHDALGYLAQAYGFRIAGTVVPSSTTLAEPSSADIAALADQIAREGVGAIFTNVDQPSSLADAVAEEAGHDVAVVPLYIESLGPPGSGAEDYIGMMMEDAQAIAANLGGGTTWNG